MDAQHKASEGGSLIIDDRHVVYRVKRSAKRKTISLSIDPESGLTVYCPRRTSIARLEAVLKEKGRWVLEKTAKAEAIKAKRSTIKWESGAMLPYLGQIYPLERVPKGRSYDLRLEAQRLLLILPNRAYPLVTPEEVRDQAIRGYRKAAGRELMARVRYFQEQLGLVPSQVRIKDQKRRWGSCSAKGTVNLNWRLVLAPPQVIDYVIVHELCHLKELNHSSRFWGRVGNALPDYAQRRAWLRENGALLFI